MTRHRTSVLAALTLAVLLSVSLSPAAKLVCQVRQTRTGSVCWTTYPMAVCRVVQ